MIRRQLPPANGRRRLPAAHALAEVDRLRPGRRPLQETGQIGPARGATPHRRPGEGARQADCHPGQQARPRGGGEGQDEALDHRLRDLEGNQGARSDAPAERPGAPALVPEPVEERLRPQGGDGAQGVQPEAAQPVAAGAGAGQEINGAGREEGGRSVRDPDGLRLLGAVGGDPGRELVGRHADPRR